MKKQINDMPWEKNKNGFIPGNEHNRIVMRDLLNETGPGMCLAKWTQVTMHLGVGLTHSCHHPVAHKIDLEELKDNPGALHNTEVKKKARKQMLNGERPSECDFCWRIEDNTGEISDRALKSLDQYSIHDHDDIIQLNGDENIFPRYVEVSFSHACNFKCAYCGPAFSSKWAEEIKQQGPYKLSHGTDFNHVTDVPLKASDENPYTEAFWKWFPEAKKYMHTLRITGGEPLMSKHTFKVMEHLLEHPEPELELAINSNGCPPAKLWLKFTDLVNQLISSKSIKKFTLFTSAENSNIAAEYTRTGMDWELFKSNIDYFMENTYNTRLTFMAAFNILSITTFKDFLEYVLFLKRRYNKNGMYKWLNESGMDTNTSLQYGLSTYRIPYMPNLIDRDSKSEIGNRVGVDIPYVRAPEFLDANIASMEMLQEYLLPAVDFMYKNLANNEWHGLLGFESLEALKLKRIFVDALIAVKDARNHDETTTRQDIAKQRARFYEFIIEYDKRRGTDFTKSLPEMTSFYNVCKLEYQKLRTEIKKDDNTTT